jgi:hypothetical protein
MMEIEKNKAKNKIKTIKTLEKNLEFLELSLNKSGETKDKIIEILDRYDKRFTTLTSTMNELNKKIEVLKKGYDSLEITISLIEKTLIEYDVSNKIENRLNIGINEDLDTFLQMLEQLNNNILFFTNHKYYKGSEFIITQLGNYIYY